MKVGMIIRIDPSIFPADFKLTANYGDLGYFGYMKSWIFSVSEVQVGHKYWADNVICDVLESDRSCPYQVRVLIKNAIEITEVADYIRKPVVIKKTTEYPALEIGDKPNWD
jgi:hypothetical protein